MNNIKILENILNNLNSSIDNITSADYINTDKMVNIKEYTNKYKGNNNIDDEYNYFSIFDILENITEQIKDVTEVIQKDLQIEYKKALEINIKENGKREVPEVKKEISANIPEAAENINHEKIKLNTLSGQRKIIKASSDKIYRIIEKIENRNTPYIHDIYLQLNKMNEDIKDNKEVVKWDFIENIWSITHDIRRLTEFYYDDKRKVKTLQKIHDDINNIIYSISPKNDTDNCTDDLPF